MKKLNINQFAEYLTPRPEAFHKGDAGHVLIVGGDEGYAGSVHLAAKAALRVGAGLVSIITKTPALHYAEVMCHPDSALKQLLTRARVVVIGPGLGQSEWGKNLFDQVLASDKPLVVDADGLNLLAKNPYVKDNWILTPHPGEAARLLNVENVQADRVESVTALQKKFGGIVVLKGAGSLIAAADEIALCTAGNPGMASGGMGDVLSGVIAGLIAQQFPLKESAQLGVLIHAMAGDAAAKDGQRGMVASDLMPHLRRLVNPESF